jgi:hypothetical protein
MPRKTIQVTTVVEMANNYLRNSQDDNDKERLVLASFVESILHKTDQYGGFAYLTHDDMRNSNEGKSIGIEFTEEHDPVYHDQSRRRYWVKNHRDHLGKQVLITEY